MLTFANEFSDTRPPVRVFLHVVFAPVLTAWVSMYFVTVLSTMVNSVKACSMVPVH